MKATELVDEISRRSGMAKEGVKKIVDATIATLADAARKGEDVVLPGFGQFKVKDVPARQGRNPSSGEVIEIAATRKLSFTPAKAIKDALKPAD
jgi:DNA-binding protein HU-beta